MPSGQTTVVLGHIVASSNALKMLTQDDIRWAIEKHRQGDWGDVGANDKRENDRALEIGERLLSAYTSFNCVKFWIITEADRSVTTVLLPEDY